MKYFHLIMWKEFQDGSRKLIDKQEIINTDNIEDGLKQVNAMNAQKRLTTTDYRTVNLSLLLKDKGLKLEEAIKED